MKVFGPSLTNSTFIIFVIKQKENRKKNSHKNLWKAPYTDRAELPLGVVCFFEMTLQHIPMDLQSAVRPMDSK